MTTVHGNDQVEPVEVLIHHRPRGGIDVEPVLPSHASRARVGPLSLMKPVGSRRIHDEARAQPRLSGKRFEDRLGQRRPTDVSGADEEDARGRQEPGASYFAAKGADDESRRAFTMGM